ncbi:Plasmodium exported protein (Pm-fam-a like), unknown function [Plasmodium malariae]|uniref:Fam-l protein n=1 Tax=Plasmodium malariae TaxID=5858 RepID=A0A1A8WW15_PLAMA|nr:Plasmodium exported protein (Pm-fam-a like), unknown function [Plasmodium malariae]
MKLLLFIKIVAFVLLTWISQFYNDSSTWNTYFEEKYKLDIILCGRYYRLLAKCTKDKYSSNVRLIQGIPNNGIQEKYNVHESEMGVTGKKKISRRTSLQNEKYYKNLVKNKCSIFETKKYSHLEKKIFKELDYENYLKNNRTISDKLYKKIICKKYGLRLALPLLIFVLLPISFILDYSCSNGFINWLFYFLKMLIPDWLKKFHEFLRTSHLGWFFKKGKSIVTSSYVAQLGGNVKKVTESYVSSFFVYLIYVLPFIILGVTLILWIVYYHKKVKKFENIKFTKK